MTDPNLEIKVREVLARKFSVAPDRIVPSARLAEDLGIDSFGGIELMFELEEALGVSIPESGVEQVRTVQDIIDTLKKLK